MKKEAKLINLKLSNPLYSTIQLRSIERLAVKEFHYNELTLMKTAGEIVFNTMLEHYPKIKNVAVICGSGNNGGDGYVVARTALLAGLKVAIGEMGYPKTEIAQFAYQAYRKVNGFITDIVSDALRDADIIVDGLLGTGMKGEPSHLYRDAINMINTSGLPIVSIDIPSGLNGDTGHSLLHQCVQATMTVTFIAIKFGMLTGNGVGLSGKVYFNNLGLPKKLMEKFTPISTTIPVPKLKKLDHNINKRQCGSVVVAGGDLGMLGAVILTSRAAMRCGSGMVSVLSTQSHLDQAALSFPELMSFCLDGSSNFMETMKNCDVLILGPGMGQGKWGERVFDHCIEINKLKVLDADALNWLVKKPVKNEKWILTPHPGEAARLLHIPTEEVQSNRPHSALSIAKRYGGICVLKGSGTIITDSNGKNSICCQGNPGMATAGMGDVLSGIVGSLLGQGIGLFDSAQIGVWLHANAADQQVHLIGEKSLVASDVIDMLPVIFQSLIEDIAT